MLMEVAQMRDHQIYKTSHLLLALNLSNPQQSRFYDGFAFLFLFMALTVCRCLHEKSSLRTNSPSCTHVVVLNFSRDGLLKDSGSILQWTNS